MTTTLTAPPAAPPAPRLRSMRYEPEPDAAAGQTTPCEPEPTAPGPTASARLRRELAATVRAALEVLDGMRPQTHLGHHFDAATLRYWRVAAHQRQVRAPARVVRMLMCLPRPGAAEVTAVCDIDGRVRALAARFEQPDPASAWHCTALRLG